ncbi:cupin domain-containing protein [Saccharopolyspora spinosporotrichia]
MPEGPKKDLLHVPASEGQSVWIGADIYTLKATKETTGGSLSLMEVSVPPGDGPPPHVHSNEDEGIYVLAGELEFFTDGRTFLAGPVTSCSCPAAPCTRSATSASTPARL